MSDVIDRSPEPAEDDEAFERMLAKHDDPTPEVLDAIDELEAARIGLADSLDTLGDATRSALDVPAKIRRNPVKTAALVGGTGFLLAGGPRRVVRAVGRRLRGRRPDPYEGLLPPQIEQVLKDSGVARDPEVRRALNKDFAQYLKQKGEYEPEPTAQATFWRTFDRVAGPLGVAGARIMVQRLMEAEQDRAMHRTELRERARARSEARKAAAEERG
jgi:hypothetical protein